MHDNGELSDEDPVRKLGFGGMEEICCTSFVMNLTLFVHF